MDVSIGVARGFAHGHGGRKVDRRLARKAVEDAAYNTAHHALKGGVPELAERMEVSSGTLMKKVNPATTTHSLSLGDSIELQAESDDLSVLHAMADVFGYVCVKAAPASSGDVLALNWQMAALISKMQHAIADALSHGVTANSLRRCNVTAAEATAAINNMQGALRARLPLPPEEHV